MRCKKQSRTDYAPSSRRRTPRVYLAQTSVYILLLATAEGTVVVILMVVGGNETAMLAVSLQSDTGC